MSEAFTDRDLLERLHGARLRLASVKAEVAQKEEAFKAENAGLFAREADALTAVMEADQAVRQQAIRLLRETGDLKPMPGVSIKLMPRPLEYDPQEALAWAKKHDMYLTLDAKKFEHAVRGDPDTFAGFVTVPEKQPTPFIAGDLGPVLDGMGK